MADTPKDLTSSIASALAAFATKGTGPKLSPLEQLFTGVGLPFQPPPVIRDRWFKGESIRIDGYTFERCRFDGCSLVTEMATFTFKSCFISPDCGLYLVGPALKVARLLMHTLTVKNRITRVAGEEALYATLNQDGTFSLE